MLSSEAHSHAATDLQTTRIDPWEFRHAAITDVGQRRDHNEDFYLVVPNRKLFIVADGMGGHAAGEVASRLAAETIAAYFEEVQLSTDDHNGASPHLVRAIEIANASIHDEARRRASQRGMGTTAVALLFSGDRAHWAHVGDSRLYRLRGDELTPLTRDHSLLEQTLATQNFTDAEARDFAAHFPYKNILTRGLGTNPKVDVDVDSAPVRHEDLFVMTTDGLHDTIDDDEIARILMRHRPHWSTACDSLVHAANRAGGPDNITIACVEARALHNAR